MNGYKTISENIEFEIAPIKKSRFIAYICKVANHIEVLNSLNAIKNSYPGANHYCWAYSLLDNNQYRFNDDGEPSGSAGKPILSHIQGFEVTNVLVVVVRYFGGTRLGVGGLIRAYGQAAKEGLALAKIIHVEHQIQISIEYDYSETAIVDTLIKYYDIKIVKEDYSDSIFRILKIDTLNKDIFLKEIKNMTKGKIKITVH
ncbi:YigZ family protein [Francisella hispaniensis]|uniref:YigZ family protein n=1 Tax=Francisella hispaniensis FSC454 TaxID=1088883 RepID=A0AAC9J6S3_9GAMM|nr:YigZ family protein [Francisella hispaniensis]APD50031.1 YigZ family protein [Francisella hispaniensis FSC454]KYW86180.1 ABC transporter [Francisella hispaniensis FSC454]